jgi:PAS domain S-box-containing protein
VVFANNAIRESQLYSLSGELINSETLDRVHPDDQPRLVEAYLGLGEGIPIRGIEYRIRTGTGKWLHHNMNAAIVTNTDEELSEIVAFIRDVTLERQREAQVVRRNKELEILNSLISNLSSSSDYEEMITRSLSIISEFTGADMLTLISVGGPEGNTLNLEGHLWVPDDYMEFLKGVFPRIPATGMFDGTEIQVLADMEKVPQEFKKHLKKYNIRFVMSVPVTKLGAPIAYVIAGLKTDLDLDEEDMAILRAVGDQLGLVLETARLMRDQVE